MTSLILGIMIGIFITEASLLLVVKLSERNDTEEDKKDVD